MRTSLNVWQGRLTPVGVAFCAFTCSFLCLGLSSEVPETVASTPGPAVERPCQLTRQVVTVRGLMVPEADKSSRGCRRFSAGSGLGRDSRRQVQRHPGGRAAAPLFQVSTNTRPWYSLTLSASQAFHFRGGALGLVIDQMLCSFTVGSTGVHSGAPAVFSITIVLVKRHLLRGPSGLSFRLPCFIWLCAA